MIAETGKYRAEKALFKIDDNVDIVQKIKKSGI